MVNIDKKTLLDFCYIVNSKINFNKLDKTNQAAFKYLETKFFAKFDKEYKLTFRSFNTLAYQIGNLLDIGNNYDEIYIKLRDTNFSLLNQAV